MPSKLLMAGSLSLPVVLLLARLILNKMEGRPYLHCKSAALAFQQESHKKKQRMAEDDRHRTDFTQAA